MIAQAIEEFGRQLGVRGLSLNAQRELVLEVGELGLLTLADRGEELHVGFTIQSQIRNEPPAWRILELAHPANGTGFPIEARRIGFGHETVLAIRLPAQRISGVEFERAIDQLTETAKRLTRPT